MDPIVAILFGILITIITVTTVLIVLEVQVG